MKAREIHARIAGSRLLVLPNAAHCAVVESRGDFTTALLGFLREPE